MLDKAVKFLEFVTICMVFRFIVMLFCIIVSYYRWLDSSWTYQYRHVLNRTQTLKTIINERMNMTYLFQNRIFVFFISLGFKIKVFCYDLFDVLFMRTDRGERQGEHMESNKNWRKRVLGLDIYSEPVILSLKFLAHDVNNLNAELCLLPF